VVKIVPLLAFLFLAVACVHSNSTPGATRLRCTSEQVDGLARRFVSAFNAGDLRELDRLFASEPDFQWYCTDAPGERFQGDAYNRSTLIAYFRARHQAGDRLILRWFRFNGYNEGYGHFEYRLTRSAASLPPTRYVGKGAAICGPTRDVIAVWSMGREQT
jgi:hypothetical protein